MIKVLIVEDEPILRKSLLALFDWETLGCNHVKECKNGVEAISIIEEEVVDILITDIKMPGVDGIELIKYIRENNLNICVIILTAFSDFKYTKEAIRLEVFDYIVKSDFVNELPKVVERAVKELKMKRSLSASYGDLLLTEGQLGEILTKSILRGETIDTERIRMWAEKRRIPSKQYIVIMSKFEKIPENFENSILNFYELVFKETQNWSYWIDENELVTILGFENNKESDELFEIEKLCKEVLQAVKQYMQFEISIGISRRHNLISKINIAYREAECALERTLENVPIVLHSNLLHDDTENGVQITKISKELFARLYAKEVDSIKKYTAEVFKNEFCYKLNIVEVKLAVVLIFNEVVKNMPTNFTDMTKFEQIIHEFNYGISSKTNFREIYQTFLGAMQELEIISNVENHHENYLVKGVLNIIEKKYAIELRLEDIADELNVNASYLSRLFKKETGRTIIHYLNNYRVEIAKTYLSDKEVSIAEVGEKVGIIDPSYFSTVFTQFTSVSPKIFRYKYKQELNDK